jgi:hypothetical protein
MTVMTDEDYHRKSRRRETFIMTTDAAIVVLAVASFALWAAGLPLPVPAWLAIAAVLAVANIYAQRLQRLLRETNRELLERCHWLQEQWHAAVTRIFN